MIPVLPQIQTNVLVFISLALCVLAAIIILSFVIPLQINQVGVVNGLAKLRKQLLAYGVITFTTTTIAAYFLTQVSLNLIQSHGTYVSTVSQILLFVFSLSKFLIAIIGATIYHQQYVVGHEE